MANLSSPLERTMMPPLTNNSRRTFLQGLALGSFAWSTPGLFAEELTATPAQTEGPFYPDKLPLDTDNDLLIINDEITPAVGEVTHLAGKILTTSGQPLKNSLIEIWQCDSQGAYIHSRSGNRKNRDGNFQGYGRFLTGSAGEYYFRTIKPVAYPGRTPHIHVKVSQGKHELLTTQCYIQGEPQNEKDGVLRGMRNPKERALLMIPFDPIPDSRIGELSAKFDIVLGKTPNS
jgi:protocatechuate 3,4-dioxygenase, beta subunit